MLCKQVVDEWIQRQSVEEAVRAQEKEKSKSLAGISLLNTEHTTIYTILPYIFVVYFSNTDHLLYIHARIL